MFSLLTEDQREMRLPLTNSIMSDLISCPRRGYYQIVKQYSKPQSTAMRMGEAFHLGMEYRSIDAAANHFQLLEQQQGEIVDQDEMDKFKINTAIVAVMTHGALEQWEQFKVQYPEMEFAVPITNPSTGRMSQRFYLAGKIDGIAMSEDGRWWLLEYKTSSQTPDRKLINQLELDMQISIYYHAATKFLEWNMGTAPQGVLYRIARKPSIRRKKTETVYDFIDRMKWDYVQRPDFYFYEEKVPRSPKQMEQFEEHLWQMTKLIRYMINNDIWPMNTKACGEYGGCDFRDLCLQVPDAEYLFETGSLTPELSIEGGNPFATNGES